MNKRLEESIERRLEKVKALSGKEYFLARNEFIRYCYDYLLTYKKIGELVGLTKQRVAQILQVKRK